VFASADLALARELAAEGRIDPPRLLATNRLVLLVASGNPAAIAGPADLRARDVRFVIADEGVPLGDYTRELFRRLGLGELVLRASSYEADARGTVGKVALGEADAALVYATDAAAAGGAVEAVPLPAAAQPRIAYAIAAVRGRPRVAEARAYVARAVGPEGRSALQAAGFGVP
jgi:molybdate transport system substrate-binding protein